MFVEIVTFVELPGSCHPTNQILTQIVVFIIFILFAAKLAPYYPSRHCTRPFLVIFVKIVLFDVFAVTFGPCHPSSHFTAWFFVVFVKILFFVSFVGVFGPLLCTKPWLHSAIFCNFRQNRWALSSHLSVLSESLEPLMPHCHCAQQFLKMFCQNCFFSIFFGAFRPSHTTCHCPQQFFFKFLSKSFFLSVSLTTCDYL